MTNLNSVAVLNQQQSNQPVEISTVLNEDKLQALLQTPETIQADLQGGIKKSLILQKISQKLKCVPVTSLISSSDFYDIGILKSVNYSENNERSFIRCTYELLNADSLRNFLTQS